VPQIKSYLTIFAGDLRRSFIDLATIIGVIAFFQFVILRSVPANIPSMFVGLLIVGVGLAFFMRGLEVGVFPLGEELAKHLAHSGSRFWLIVFAFVIGFATTIAEPALIAVAHKAAIISGGHIDALILRGVIAFSVGLAIVIGVIRLILNHPIHWYIIGGYLITLIITYFSPPEIVGLAYDSGGITTSTITVPLIAALGIGLATSLKNRNPIIDGFGLIAFASLTPMIFVQLYGIVAYTFVGAVPSPADTTLLLDTGGSFSAAATAALAQVPLVEYAQRLLTTAGDIAPIVMTILFFYFFVLKKRIEQFKKRVSGFLMILFGLYAFVIGLEIGLFPIGESIAQELVAQGNVWLIYLFSFTIGFATTIAEPALTAIARRAEEISGGSIRALVLRLSVGVGVGVGILLGAYRIVHGDSIVMYLLAGYLVVVIMTYFAPKTVISVAYDAGGVTTSTVTVPIIAALGLGLAVAIPGRDPLIDGFGLIAFASLFPVITVLGYGIAEMENIRRHERKIARMESSTMERVRSHFDAPTDEEEDESRTQRLKKEIVTITGFPGSGVSSVAHMVARSLQYRYFSSGDLFRKIAVERGMSVEELNMFAEKHGGIDHEIDELVRELGEISSKLVIDSRLGYHWIHGSFKVYLSARPRIAAERVSTQTRKHTRVAENEETTKEALRTIEHNAKSQHKRYQELYGIDIENMRPFDLVVDTTDKDIATVTGIVVQKYRAWIEKKM